MISSPKKRKKFGETGQDEEDLLKRVCRREQSTDNRKIQTRSSTRGFSTPHVVSSKFSVTKKKLNKSDNKCKSSSILTMQSPAPVRNLVASSISSAALTPLSEPSFDRKKVSVHKNGQASSAPVERDDVKHLDAVHNVESKTVQKETTESSAVMQDSVGIFVGFSRLLVVLTVVIILLMSCVHWDLSKHNLNNSVVFSGRRIYSILTLGHVQPWEWGVPSEDASLLHEAQIMKSSLQASPYSISAIEQAGAVTFDAIDDVKEASHLIRLSLTAAITVQNSSGTRISIKDFRTRQSEHFSQTRKHFQKQDMVLDEAYVTAIIAEGNSLINRKIFKAVEKVTLTINTLCTIDNCKIWSDLWRNLQLLRDDLMKKSFGAGFLSGKSLLFVKLSNAIKINVYRNTVSVSKSVVESAASRLDPSCIDTIQVDGSAVVCFRNILSYILEDIMNGNNINRRNGALIAQRTNNRIRKPVNDLVDFDGVRPTFKRPAFRMLVNRSAFTRLSASLRLASQKEIVAGNEVIVAALHSQQNSVEDLTDFAKANRGCIVVSATKSPQSLTSPPYFPSLLNLVGLQGRHADASIVISSTLPRLGDCYAFMGTAGNLTVLFPGPTLIQRVGLYRMSMEFARPFDARSFRLYGWQNVPASLSNGMTRDSVHIYMGTFSMPSHPDEESGSFHVFSLRNQGQPLRAVTFSFEGNFGELDFTCVYRIQLFGKRFSKAVEQ